MPVKILPDVLHVLYHTGEVLILAQRGDWAACDQALKGLEKAGETSQVYMTILTVLNHIFRTA